MERDGFGTVRSLTVRCLSELAWRDNARMRRDIDESGGFSTDQYDVRWTPGNAAGVTVLLQAEGMDGQTRTLLLDAGWDPGYIGEVFRREGVDSLLAYGKIGELVVTHEHIDHFWGVPAVLRHRPDIRVRVPAGISPRSRELLRASGHAGELVEMSPGLHVLFPGCVSVVFDTEINLRAHGEQVLYFDVAGKGIVTVTGCCHPGAVALLDYARENFRGSRIHAVYGGLHIAPFDEWGEAQEKLLDRLAGYGVERWACNHCTGLLAVRRMLERGFPVVPGSGRHGSRSPLWLGNGDTITF
jgi:7,8-dihydropterin-6-yl-methyl-4-(beta-D-ribofuranosyl)aminobenzene 5'-phosphate synthase